MELALQILGILVLIIPTAIVIYNRWFSKKAAAKKRRKAEDLTAQKEREKAQSENMTDAETHAAQDEAEERWRKQQGL